jgi:O-antigen/teichoic acid export membrane protein
MTVVSQEALEAAPVPRRARLSGVVAGLTAANVLSAAMGFVTGPLLARALGASGRGDLAAIQVPLVLIPGVLGFGIPAYAYRTVPRGEPVGKVLGSLGLPLLVCGVVTAACAVPAADALAGGRETVRTFLIVVFLSAPFLLLASLLQSCLSALERWRDVIAMTMVPFLVPCLATVALYIAGDLTVGTAAVATVAGSLLALIPGVRMMLRARPITVRRKLTRAGLRFGLRSWIGGLASIVNLRLDQFLMITFVAPRILGLYAVATTISGVPTLMTGALSPPLMTRIAAGERSLLPQAVRISLASTVLVNAAAAAVTPFALTLLFGRQFSGAVPMALLLLLATIPLSTAGVLSSGLQADGDPVVPTIGEGIALLITVGGLLAVLHRYGGIGAACVSLAAYSASFAFQLFMARRRLGQPISQFIVPTRADLAWAVARIRGVLHVSGQS